jgi:death-on-curing protein
VLAIHERLLAEHGGASGRLDVGRLEAALDRPRNRLAYGRADIPRLAAAYAFALTRNHPFADGNKRVALTVAGVFLELNGYHLDALEQDAASVMRALSSGEIGEEEFARWLRASISKVPAKRHVARSKRAGNPSARQKRK